MKRIHVDENVTIRTNEEADKAFFAENDIAYFDNERGIAKVPKERWDKAQRTERKHWMEIGMNSKDDRNFYHLEKFNNYKSIENKVFKHALEVGCGPFTNLRIIGNYCQVEKCSLNDPLIKDYLTHLNCSFDNKNLFLDKDSHPKKTFWNQFSNKKISIDKIYSCPFEAIECDVKFDLIVIINVIEHCYDLELFFNKVIQLLTDDGIIIFEDKLYDLVKLQEDINLVYDAAHPLRVNKDLVTSFLDNNFQKKYSVIESNKTELEGNLFVWDDIYYVGEKKHSALIQTT